jgi:hypothetical protein
MKTLTERRTSSGELRTQKAEGRTSKQREAVLAGAARRLTNACALAEELTFLLWQRWKHSFQLKATRRMYERQMPGIQVVFGAEARSTAALVTQAQANLERRAQRRLAGGVFLQFTTEAEPAPAPTKKGKR